MVDSDSIEIGPLCKEHARGAFDCGVSKINNFLRNNARKQHDAYQVRVFVACEKGAADVLGFYSLTLRSFEPSMMDEGAQKKFERVGSVPTIYLAMIGVRAELIGRGIGYHLMGDAFARSLRISEDVGAYAITLDALDDEVAAKYERYGYERFSDGELAMFLPLKTLRDARDS